MRGFTLVEVLVALFILSVLAMLSWRALDGMSRVQTQVFAHSDQTLALQSGLGQWRSDLDAVQENGIYNAMDFDGRVLRITRKAAATGLVDTEGSLQLVAWTLVPANGTMTWQRWASRTFTTRGELRQAWQAAGDWASSGGASASAQIITPVIAATSWQLLYYRNNSWTNPQSSADAATESPNDTGTGTGTPEAAPRTGLQAIPDGVRLALTLASPSGMQGEIVRDWIHPIVGGTQ